MKEEFHCVNFKLYHGNLKDFYQTSVPCVHPIVLAVVRGLFAVYSIVFMFISAAWDIKSARWLFFATSWSYLIVSIYFVYAFGMSCLSFSNKEKKNHSEGDSPTSGDSSANGDSVEVQESSGALPWCLKVFWLTYTTAITIAPFVFVIYWAVLHDYNKKLKADLDTYLIFDRHGVQFALLFVEFFLHRIPFRFLHVVYPLVYAVTCLIVNVVYWAISGKIIYKVFDWNEKPGKAIGWSVAMLTMVVVVHFSVYWLHVFKDKCIAKSNKGVKRSDYMTLT